MEERYKKEEAELLSRKREVKSEAGDADQVKDEDLESQLASENDLMSDEEADVARNVNLPSNVDSKLWRLKVKPGIERQLVMRLTNKLFASLNNGNPLMVL
jgi:transcription elongation factor SPT5